MNEPQTTWRFEKSICSEAAEAVELITNLIQRLDYDQWSPRDVFGIHLAMEEALMNAIKHGNCSDCTKQIHVVLALTPNEFYAKITDDGEGFDPDCVPDPTADENLKKTCGRGVMLIKNFVDRVIYSKKGNSIEMFKSKSTANSA